jgi:hypothetical protein
MLGIRLRRGHRDERGSRKRSSYANVVATVALVLAIGGGSAWAARHYTITSPNQIKPSVLKALKGKNGKSGTNGTNGAIGAIGPTGAQGTAGGTGATGAAGTAGATGVAGATGATGATGFSAASAFSGRVTSVPTTTSGLQTTVYGAPIGISTENGTEASVQTLSPNSTITAQNLTVLKTGATVPSGDQIIVDMDLAGSPMLICGIQAGETTCNSNTQTVSVPPGSTLSIKIIAQAASATIPGFDLLFGFQAG